MFIILCTKRKCPEVHLQKIIFKFIKIDGALLKDYYNCNDKGEYSVYPLINIDGVR